MSNPLLGHPILQHLPYELLKRPTVEGIRTFLAKRRRFLIRMCVLSTVASLLFWILNRPPHIDDILMSVILAALAVGLYRQASKTKMTDDEIREALGDTHPQANDVPA